MVFGQLVGHTAPRELATDSVLLRNHYWSNLFGNWVYAFALMSLALLMQMGWTMRGMLL